MPGDLRTARRQGAAGARGDQPGGAAGQGERPCGRAAAGRDNGAGPERRGEAAIVAVLRHRGGSGGALLRRADIGYVGVCVCLIDGTKALI